MAHITLRSLIMNGDEAASNQAMVENLQRNGALRSQRCIAAFEGVDRGHFWVEGASAYADMPLRHGRLHQSAPHIYARALEALMPLQPGMSFLNVGSGTGYFSSVVAELIGDSSINDGIDIWPDTLAHAVERCRQLGKNSIHFTLGNVYQLDLDAGMRYDRIYFGACANSDAKYLYGLLEIGGILVGPFQVGHGQQLCRVVRETEKIFKVEHLNSVHFATLVEPAPSTAPLQKVDVPQPVGLPGVPFTFALRQQPWSAERNWAYPEAFKRVAAVVLLGQHADPALPCLPPEIWAKHVLPWCSRSWFDPPVIKPSRTASALAVAGSAVKKVFHFGKQQEEAPSFGYSHELDDNSGLVILLLAEQQHLPPRRRRARGGQRFWECAALARLCTWPLKWCNSDTFKRTFQRCVAFTARCLAPFV